jgi:hypothetical protein
VLGFVGRFCGDGNSGCREDTDRGRMAGGESAAGVSRVCVGGMGQVVAGCNVG